jgi:hypothetical protein
MFCLTEGVPIPRGSGYVKNISYKFDGGSHRMCAVDTWGMNSCAVMTLRGFNHLPQVLNESFNINEFLAFLATVDAPTWRPKEAYFLITDAQCKDIQWVNKLIKHKTVRRRDRFHNKAHGPNSVNLFRWSAEQDFKRVKAYV